MTAPTTAPPDVAVAETSAAVENVLLATYDRLSALPIIQGLDAPASSAVQAFITRTMQHHADHLTAFNAAAARLGGKRQGGLDQPLMTTVVAPGVAALLSAADAVMFSARLEMIAAATFTAQVAAVSDRQLRASLASIAGVECQHQGVLLVIATLLGATPEAVGFPLAPRDLPPLALGPSAAFLRTDQARPPLEGVVR